MTESQDQPSDYRTIKDAGLKPRSRRAELAETVFFIVLSSLLYTVSFHYFVAPSNFAPGGIAGILALVKYLFRVSPDALPSGLDLSPLLIIVINLLLVLATYRQLSREFLVRTLAESVLITALLFVLDNWIDPGYRFSIAGTPVAEELAARVVASVFGGVTCGAALWCALRVNASTGGSDIVAAAIQKRTPYKSMAVIIFLINSLIVVISAFLYRDNLMPVFLAFIYMFVTTKTCDTMMCGMKAALKFEVVTDYGAEISKEIIETLGHGATVIPAEGMFEHRPRGLLICVIKPRQVSRFKAIISRYPGSFAYIGTVNEIIGKFNPQR